MKHLIALLAVGLLGSPALASTDEYSRCKRQMEEKSRNEQYEFGKLAAQVWQTVMRQDDWTPEERAEFNPDRDTSRHGMGGMTSSAQVAWMMWDTKGKEFKVDHCVMGWFQIFDRTWSGAHSGFTDYLSPKLKSLYFSLPER